MVVVAHEEHAIHAGRRGRRGIADPSQAGLRRDGEVGVRNGRSKAGTELDEGTLKVYARERLAGPKVPRDFVFMESLPRNPTGKVLKRELKGRA